MNLNAILKLRHFLEHNQTFPQFQELLPHLQAEAHEQRVNLQALKMILRSLPVGREICFAETAWASHPATSSSLLKPLLWRQVLWLLHVQLPGGTTLSSCSRNASCSGSARTWRSQFLSQKTRPWQAGRTEGMKVRPLVENWWSAFSRTFQVAWCAEPFAVARHCTHSSSPLQRSFSPVAFGYQLIISGHRLLQRSSWRPTTRNWRSCVSSPYWRQRQQRCTCIVSTKRSLLKRLQHLRGLLSK